MRRGDRCCVKTTPDDTSWATSPVHRPPKSVADSIGHCQTDALVAAMNGNHGAGHSGLRPTRPPTVDEALQYSPLSSIVPFNAGNALSFGRRCVRSPTYHGTDVIPFPTAVPSLPSSRILNEEERAASRKVLDILENESAQPPGTPSIQLQHTLQEFQRLLDSDDLCYLWVSPYIAVNTAEICHTNGSAASSRPRSMRRPSQHANNQIHAHRMARAALLHRYLN